MRRDKNDIKWQECKEQVYKLDNRTCCLCKVMTVHEQLMQKNYLARGLTMANVVQIDPAHHLAVSQRPDIMYDVDNVYCLCRWHHDNLDNSRNPFNQDHITKDEIELFWQRIMDTRKPQTSDTLDIETPFYEDL